MIYTFTDIFDNLEHAALKLLSPDDDVTNSFFPKMNLLEHIYLLVRIKDDPIKTSVICSNFIKCAICSHVVAYIQT